MSYTFSTTLDASFEDSVARTRAALARHGFGVLTQIDVAATMKAKLDKHMPAYLILGACSPAHAFRALSVEPQIGAMLPCNVIVRDLGDGRVEVSAVDPVASMQAVENAALGEVAREVQDALRSAIAEI
jgi:uncharacterized protein (DUF302 family)